MSSSPSTNRPHPAWAWFCIALGVMPLLVAFGVIPVQESQLHAPMWVLGLCGVVFVCAGCALLLGERSRFNDLLGGLICLCFAGVGIWVAVFSPADGFSGGVPLLSDQAKVTLARWMFGCGAVLCLVMFGLAMVRVLRRDA